MDVPLPHPGPRGSRDDGSVRAQMRSSDMSPVWTDPVRPRESAVGVLAVVACLGLLVACRTPRAAPQELVADRTTDGGYEQVLRGRKLVVGHACGECHGGRDDDPAADGWLAGLRKPEDEFQIGPCGASP